MPKILLTHTPESLQRYYGDKALAALQALGDVDIKQHQSNKPLQFTIQYNFKCTKNQSLSDLFLLPSVLTSHQVVLVGLFINNQLKQP